MWEYRCPARNATSSPGRDASVPSLASRRTPMLEPGVPVFDLADAEMYGWRFEPDLEGNLWLRVIDGRGAICFRPGGHLTHDGDGNMRGSVQVIDLEGSLDPDGNAWLSDGVQVTGECVRPTRNIHAIIFAPGGFLRFEGGQLLHKGIEFVAAIQPGPAEPAV
jgi:hypothetical protein